jgi:hypothetical protein
MRRSARSARGKRDVCARPSSTRDDTPISTCGRS